jgi:uncharacterized membrane protein
MTTDTVSISNTILKSNSVPSLTPGTSDKALAIGSGLLLLAVAIAIVKGHTEWAQVPISVWVHLALIIVALGLTPVMLLRRRGDRLHRILGWIWTSGMFLTALTSLNVRLINQGSFSIIHILSVWTMIQVPIIILSARAHNIARHRSAVRGMVIGALLIAGFFTFPFNRLMGQWLFG